MQKSPVGKIWAKRASNSGEQSLYKASPVGCRAPQASGGFPEVSGAGGRLFLPFLLYPKAAVQAGSEVRAGKAKEKLPEMSAQRQSGGVQPSRAHRSSNFSSFPFILPFPAPIPIASHPQGDGDGRILTPSSSPLIPRGGEHLCPRTGRGGEVKEESG